MFAVGVAYLLEASLTFLLMLDDGFNPPDFQYNVTQ